MFGHYLITALRNFWRFRFTSLINVLGLALGLTCFLAAYGAVRYLESSDKHFANADRIHVIMEQIKIGSDIDTGSQPATPVHMAKYLRADFPQLEAVARISWLADAPVSTGQRKLSVFTFAADPELLEIFDMPFIAGDAKNALRQPLSAVVTAKAAEQLFGTNNVLGRRILLGNAIDLTITGVIDSIQQPSHFGDSATSFSRFDMLVHYDVVSLLRKAFSTGESQEPPENWLNNSDTTYVLLPKDGSLSLSMFNQALAPFAKRHIPERQRAIAEVKFETLPVWRLQLTALDRTLGNTGIGATTLLLMIGGLVVVVACLNYANLATAQATMRAKDVGIRRVLGAKGRQLVGQYLFEAGLLTLAALCLAFLAIALVAPLVRNAIAIDIGLPLQNDFSVWGFLALLLAAVTLVAGAYPALVLSRVKPVEALRSARLRVGARFVPTILVGIQFTVASFLLIAVIVIYAQNNELRQTGLGRTEDPKVVIGQYLSAAKVDFATLRAELLKYPEIKSVTAVGRLPWQLGTSLTGLRRTPDDAAKETISLINSVSDGFLDTFDMKLVAGRTFSQTRSEDIFPGVNDSSGRTFSLIVDRALAQKLGWANPHDAVGQIVYMPLIAKPTMLFRIIGVVENKPLTFVGAGATTNAYFMPAMPGRVIGEGAEFTVIRIAKDKVASALSTIDDVWDKLAPNMPSKRRFMDELFEESYKTFGIVNQVFAGLAAFAFVISIMGLFGMAVFVTGRRMHEIGIRKTLGASAGDILRLLLASFSKPVVIANLLVWPLAYLAAQAYLSVFVHRITLTPVPFVLSLIITVLIAWIAVGAQAYRAARVKPATVLRYE